MPILGCIADDLPGASEIANLFTASGLKTCLYETMPTSADPLADVIVVALNFRFEAPSAAAENAQAALMWLRSQGCSHYFIKYGDAFNCTRTGNIGPVCDAAMRLFGVPYTVLCPGAPEKGITVSCGRLYVNGKPLQESEVTPPMWDNDIVQLMAGQSKYPCVKITRGLCRGRSQVLSTLAEFSFQNDCEHFYAIPDINEESTPERVLELFENLHLVTGGSAVAAALAKRIAAGKL